MCLAIILLKNCLLRSIKINFGHSFYQIHCAAKQYGHLINNFMAYFSVQHISVLIMYFYTLFNLSSWHMEITCSSANV